jgi:hypothetical protein
MNTTMRLAIAVCAIGIAVCAGARAAVPDACTAQALVSDTTDEPRARVATGEASGAANPIGGEANPVTPTRTTQLADGNTCAPN